ncbi:glycoside hydrolase family 3 N-terminal domain-containing protein, partial [Xanthovirga aplysinae]|uniref:glycoside hydrolase family 3 N-terminal domain-containing protein n=1 Tax=Xanthovirga aplysinae TaxID=2529853 RepID=UPI0012BC6D1C
MTTNSIKKYCFLLVLAALLVSFAVPAFSVNNTQAITHTNEKQQQKTNRKIEKLLSKMSLGEKVGQMTQITLDVITKGESVFVSDEPLELNQELVLEAIKKYKVGSFLNTANNRARTPEKWNEIIDQLQEISMKELGIPTIYGVDAIHGTTYTVGATFFPQQIGMAATWNRDLVREGAEVTAYETRASGIPWDFSPVLDMGRDPRWPRMWETYGEDTYLTSEMGKQAIIGYQGEDNDISKPGRVAASLKHFMAYSSYSGKDRTPAYIPERQLREFYLPSFRAAVDQGAYTVMVNSGLINGIPVHANKNLITDLLKGELGFEGLVVTDWADIENLHNRDKVAATQKEAVKMVVNAGIDMAMVPYNFNFTTNLIELVKVGEVDMSRIDDAVRRILKVKFALGLFDQPTTEVADYKEFGSYDFEQAALVAAQESITLLKNKEEILPLKKNAKVLVTGPNANSMRTLNGGWSYSWQGEKVHEFADRYKTILAAITDKVGKEQVTFVPGVEYNNEGKYFEEKNLDIEAVVEAVENVDYIILALGENSYTEKPGDLTDMYISENQSALGKALAATGKPVILILNEGRPRLISKFESEMAAVVQMYLPGNFGGVALADILFGDVNPSGKLPYTYPKYPNSLLTYDHQPSENQEKMEGVYDYESSFEIQYPFGHGLSYTSFEYSDLKINKAEFNADDVLEVSVKVTNTGDRSGKEVVQFYASDLFASVSPSVKRLKGFEKIELAPKESRVVSFQISAKDLAFV